LSEINDDDDDDGDPDPPTLQMDRDGRMTCSRNSALCTIVHRAVKSVEVTTVR